MFAAAVNLFEMITHQVKKTMGDLKEKLDCPVTNCLSTSETYKSLQGHMVTHKEY